MCQALNDYVNGAREESRSEGIMIGKSEGIEEEKKNIVVRMLNLKYTYNEIQEITGLSKNEIQTIALLFG